MPSYKHTILVMGLLLALLVGGLLGHRAIGQSGGGMSSVASVHFDRVLAGLDQRADADRRVRALFEEAAAEEMLWKVEVETRGKEIEAMRNAGPTDPAQLTSKEEELVQLALGFEAWKRYSMERIDHESSLLWRDIYSSIQEELAKMAETGGFDVVIQNDAVDFMRFQVDPNAKVSQEAQVMQQIRTTVVLYAGEQSDLTNTLVARMNNSWNAGARKGQPAPSIHVSDPRALLVTP